MGQRYDSDAGLVLSLFPGLDLLGRAFEANGFCVVRGPDLIFGQDIRGWDIPASKVGVFDGVVGGPPCQSFSKTRNFAVNGPRYGDLISEFCRVVADARPRWWLMENVVQAPEPVVAGYSSECVVLSPRHLGDVQNRPRRFTIGYPLGVPPPKVACRFPYVALEAIDREPAVTSGKGGGRRDGCGYRSPARKAAIQGYPELIELRHRGDWTVAGLDRAIAQGVPKIVGEEVARVIREWQAEVL